MVSTSEWGTLFFPSCFSLVAVFGFTACCDLRADAVGEREMGKGHDARRTRRTGESTFFGVFRHMYLFAGCFGGHGGSMGVSLRSEVARWAGGEDCLQYVLCLAAWWWWRWCVWGIGRAVPVRTGRYAMQACIACLHARAQRQGGVMQCVQTERETDVHCRRAERLNCLFPVVFL